MEWGEAEDSGALAKFCLLAQAVDTQVSALAETIKLCVFVHCADCVLWSIVQKVVETSVTRLSPKSCI